MNAEITHGGIILQFVIGITGGIFMQLILGCNSKNTVMFLFWSNMESLTLKSKPF
jgi:hypothetical protein